MKEFEVRVEATQEMVGYVVVEAKSMEAAVALVKYQLGIGKNAPNLIGAFLPAIFNSDGK